MKVSREQIEDLHPLEVKVLLHVNVESEFSAHAIAEGGTMVLGQATQALSWLQRKKIVDQTETLRETVYELTEMGEKWKKEGSPLRQVFLALCDSQGNHTTTFDVIKKKLSSLDPSQVGAAFGVLLREDVVITDKAKNISLAENVSREHIPDVVRQLTELLERGGRIETKSGKNEAQERKEYEALLEKYSKKKGAGAMPFRKSERETRLYRLTSEGICWQKEIRESGITGQEVNALTPKMLKDGSWKKATFRPYNVTSPPNRVPVGRENSYARFLRDARDKLVALGFEEFEGPLVETEFWNSDALFMPQTHAARDIHDVYYTEEPTHAQEIEEPYLSRVSKEHEGSGTSGSRGWRYYFDRNFTRRLLLRSQGTAVSAKTLRHAQIPGKYFGILRVFRHDQVDATHLSDFYQTEGIILGEDVSVRTLLGLLRVFAEEFTDAEEIKYVPGYFPFTEPSIEVHIKHPEMGWMELGGSGIFRPEVTAPFGIDVPVAAWGIGIDRMATVQMGIRDIRELFSYDLKKNILRQRVVF